MSTSVRSILVAATLGFSLLATPAFAEIVNYSAGLTGGEEVPANDSTGTGLLEATYDSDTKLFNWNITYDGLTGPATAAHFHGPAAIGENAGPVVPIEGELDSPIGGEIELTDEQAADLQAGNWYFNIHTEQFPDGEIRGQLSATPAL